MVNIITSKTRSAWRLRKGSKYHGQSSTDVAERAREVAAAGGSKAEVENAVRELTMHDDPKRCWHNFQAGVLAGNEELTKRATKNVVKEVDADD